MIEPETSGMTLLVWHAGGRRSWRMDLVSLRPFVDRLLFVEDGSGGYLLPQLNRGLPGVPVEHLRFEMDITAEESTRRLRAMPGIRGNWVLVLQSGTNVHLGRRFQAPVEGGPRSAIHLLSKDGDARWAPVLLRGDSDCLAVDSSGRVVINVDQKASRCDRDMVVDARGVRPTSTRSLLNELERALARAREEDSPDAQLDVAECHFRLGRYSQADFWYRRCAEICTDPPARWLAQYRHALCLRHMDEPWQDIEAALVEAFERDPDRAEPLYQLARHHAAAGDHGKAFELAEVGLDIAVPRTTGWFDFPLYQHKLPLIYITCAATLGRNPECIRAANRLLRNRAVPEDARGEAASCRSRCLQRVQPVYPVSIRKRNRIVVVTPFRNAGEFLGGCIAALAAQDYTDCRFVLIDDASTDGALDAQKLEDPRFIVVRNPERRGVLRNQIDAINRHCEADDIVVYMDGDDRLVDDGALSYINNFFNATRCWVMYGQYRESSGRYGGCEPITAETGSVIEAINAMHFPMHVRAHRAGLLFHLQHVDPGLSRLRGDDGELLDAVSDMAMMRMMMQLAGLANIRYNDRVLYEYTTGNPESYTTGFESRRLQDRQSDMLGRKPPLESVDWYRPGGTTPSRVGPGQDRTGLLLIALDGMTPRLLHHWSDAGLLPHVQSILRQGHVRRIEPPRAFGNEVFWCALATGCLPGELGYYYRESWRPESYAWDFVDLDEELRRRPFWATREDGNVEMAVIDMPEAAHGGRVNGLEVTEWLPHARLSSARFSSAELEDDWINRFGADRSCGHTETMAPRTGEQSFRLQEQLLAKVEQKTDAALHYLKRCGWDLFAVGYSQAHDVGHQFWHLHDPSHPRHRPILRERYGDPLLRMYQAIDSAVGRLMEEAGAGARVALVSGLAMEAKVSGNPVLDEVLWAMERAEYADVSAADSRSTLARRRFFAVPHNNLSGAVRINLRGREAAGRVEPGAEYRATLDWIEQGLRRVVNADTGEPAVYDTVRAQEVCSGPRAQVLPDLLVIWSRKSPLRRVSTPWGGELALRARSITDTRSGDHVNEAELITNFDPGFRADRGVPAQDIAAWLAAQAER